MEDLTAIEVKKITMLANESIMYDILKYPYLDSYLELNAAILEKAKNGESSISFDFIDNQIHNGDTLELIKFNNNRIYPHSGGSSAMNNTYDYPNYLLARGFKVEVRKAEMHHGYLAKSYFISW